MKKLLLILFVFISANIFAQDKNDYLIKNDGDTDYVKIKKFDIYSIKNQSRDSVNRRVVSKLDTSDLKTIVSNGYAFEVTPVKEYGSYTHAFLPVSDSLQNIRVHNSQFDLSKYTDADITVYQIILKANGITQFTMGGLIPAAIDAADKKRSYAQSLILIKNNQDNELIDFTDFAFGKKDNSPTTWDLLKSDLKNNSECIAQIDKYIEKNDRVNFGRIEKLIRLYFKNIKLTNLDID